MITCAFEDGHTTKLRHLTTGAIVSDESGRLLLVKRADFLLEGGKWAQPGGYLDLNETAEECIRREVLEETGYELLEPQLFRLITHSNRPGDDRQNVEFVYIGKAGNKVGEADHESSEVKWFEPGELPSELAFDHEENFTLFAQHQIKPLSLPIVN